MLATLDQHERCVSERGGTLEQRSLSVPGQRVTAPSDADDATALATEPPGLSIIVPVYNECATVRRVLAKLRSVRFPVATEIVVVDDGSTDGSKDILRRLPPWDDVRVIFRRRNGGKGSAIRTALQHIRGRVMVVHDADEELDPNDLPTLFDPVHRGDAAVCYGSRFCRDVRPFRWRPTFWANRLLTALCNRLNGLHLTDMNTCYKMMRTDVARQLNLSSSGFEIEPEITTKLARLGVPIIERPVCYRPRSAAQGKKVRAFDFVRYLVAMFRCRLQPVDRSAGPEHTAQTERAVSGASG